MPLEESIPFIQENNGIPDWLDIYDNAMKNNVSWNRFRLTLKLIILDSYGKEFCDVVIDTLDKVDKIGIDIIYKRMRKIKKPKL